MKHLKSLSLFTISLGLLVGCAPAAAQPLPTATQTQAKPTATQAPAEPTATPVQVEDTTPWEVVLQTTVQHQTTLAGFLDESFGITAGYAGEVHYTTDGGKTWPKADNDSACRFGLDIVDEQTAWHCGNRGHVRLSTDGGQTWQAVTNYGRDHPLHCRFLSFLDAETGWAAAPRQLGATMDGGATWTEPALPEGIQDIVAISLRTPTDGYLLDDGGILFFTKDGGATWSSHSLDLEGGAKLVNFSSAPTAAVRFSDADHGVAVLSLAVDGELKMMALHTADGGQTWEAESLPVELGVPYLTRDGTLLTVYLSDSKEITVLRHQ